MPADDEKAQCARHRAAYQALEAERVAALDQAGKVAERVTQFLEQAPASLEHLSPRGALVAHLSLLQDARRQAHAAAGRLASIVQATSRRADAQAALTALDDAVRGAYVAWVMFGSEGARPSDRSVERGNLLAVLAETQPDFEVADAARFENDVAIATVSALEAMQGPLRHAVLLEQATPLADQIAEHVDHLEELFGQLCALGIVTEQRSMVKGFSVKLPPLPYGQFGFTVGPQDVGCIVTQWRAKLAALTADPQAETVIPKAGRFIACCWGCHDPPRQSVKLRLPVVRAVRDRATGSGRRPAFRR